MLPLEGRVCAGGVVFRVRGKEMGFIEIRGWTEGQRCRDETAQKYENTFINPQYSSIVEHPGKQKSKRSSKIK